MTANPIRLPVTVVTGFLGAGKTTLLRHLLLNSGQRLAVLVNEFGEMGIDGDLLSACGFCPEDEVGERLVELANGCLCCTVQDEFLPTMTRLLERAEDLDGIVVETSGLALPEPLVAAFGWPAIRTRTRVHAVVTVVDGEALAAGHVVGDAAAIDAQRRADPSLEHLAAIEDLFDDQLTAADLVLVSRADRLTADQVQALSLQLAARLRPGTPVLPMVRGAVEPSLILSGDHRPDWSGSPTPSAGGSGESPAPTTAVGQAIAGIESSADQEHEHEHEHDHDHEHEHDHAHVAIHAVVVRRPGAWDRHQLEGQLRRLIETEPVLRLKGRLHQAGKRLPLQIQAVGPRLECWYEGRGENASVGGDPATGDALIAPGLELVVLGPAMEAERLELACASL